MESTNLSYAQGSHEQGRVVSAGKLAAISNIDKTVFGLGEERYDDATRRSLILEKLATLVAQLYAKLWDAARGLYPDKDSLALAQLIVPKLIQEIP